jgi:hypothetical protein
MSSSFGQQNKASKPRVRGVLSQKTRTRLRCPLAVGAFSTGSSIRALHSARSGCLVTAVRLFYCRIREMPPERAMDGAPMFLAGSPTGGSRRLPNIGRPFTLVSRQVRSYARSNALGQFSWLASVSSSIHESLAQMLDSEPLCCDVISRSHGCTEDIGHDSRLSHRPLGCGRSKRGGGNS